MVASGRARCTTSTSMPRASASSASLRWRTSGAHLRASATVHSTGGSGHSSPARSNACASTRESNDALWATSTRPSISGANSRSTSAGGRRRVHHLLGDAGQPLDAPRQRPLHGHQRLEAVVQLAAAHQHRADLGQLAQVAAAAVGLGVHGQVLGVRAGLIQQVHGRACKRAARTCWAGLATGSSPCVAHRTGLTPAGAKPSTPGPRFSAWPSPPPSTSARRARTSPPSGTGAARPAASGARWSRRRGAPPAPPAGRRGPGGSTAGGGAPGQAGAAAQRAGAADPALLDRHRRARPRPGRRHRAGLAGAAGRLARHRQVHDHHRHARQPGRGRPQRALRLAARSRRRRSACAPSASAAARWRCRSSPRPTWTP